MVLADTSIWVEHFRNGNNGLETLLNEGRIICHSFVIGELACGNLRNRQEILSLLQALPMAIHAEHEEVMRLIEERRLMGKGLGYVDMHLLASSLLTGISLWTLDKRLSEISLALNLQF